MSAISFAEEILDMRAELISLRRENARLRQRGIEFDEFVAQTIRHGDAMVANTLTAILEKAR